MKASISRRQLEALSAYLDGELSPAKKNTVEGWLADDARLQIALEDLRCARQTMRQAPKIRAPHNFTLTAEMVETKVAAARLYPAMQLVSAVASVLFVLVISGDLISSSITSKVAGDRAVTEAQTEGVFANQAFMVEEQESGFTQKAGEAPLPTTASAADQIESEPIVGMAEEQSSDEAAEPEAAAVQLEDAGAAAEADGDFDPSGDQMPAAGGLGGGDSAALPTPSLETSRSHQDNELQQAIQEDAITEAEREAQQTNDGAPPLTAVTEPPAAGKWGGLAATNWLRVLEAGLAILAIMSGGIAFKLRRRE